EPPFRPRGGHWLVPPLRDGLHGRRMLGGATHRPQGPSPTQLLRQERRVGARARTRLGVAVVGCGKRGAEHACRVDLAPHASLVRLVDVDVDAVFSVAKRLRVPYSTTLDEALDDERIDIVIVCTPNHLHAETAIRAAEAGKHLVVEKPLAQNLADAR